MADNKINEEVLEGVAGGTQNVNMSNSNVGGSQGVTDNSVNNTTTTTSTQTTTTTAGGDIVDAQGSEVTIDKHVDVDTTVETTTEVGNW